MVKKKIEVEVEYPECESCGEGIFDGEEYHEIKIELLKLECHRGDGKSSRKESYFEVLSFCNKCFMDKDSLQKAMTKIEKIKEILH